MGPTKAQARVRSVPFDFDDRYATRLRVAVGRLNRRLQRESLGGVSPGQASTLATINGLKFPTIGEVAVAEQVTPPTMTRMIRLMEQRGLVIRIQDERDRRIWRVQVSPEGRKVLLEIRSHKNAFLAQRLAGLDSAQASFAPDFLALLEYLAAEE